MCVAGNGFEPTRACWRFTIRHLDPPTATEYSRRAGRGTGESPSPEQATSGLTPTSYLPVSTRSHAATQRPRALGHGVPMQVIRPVRQTRATPRTVDLDSAGSWFLLEMRPPPTTGRTPRVGGAALLHSQPISSSTTHPLLLVVDRDSQAGGRLVGHPGPRGAPSAQRRC